MNNITGSYFITHSTGTPSNTRAHTRYWYSIKHTHTHTHTHTHLHLQVGAAAVCEKRIKKSEAFFPLFSLRRCVILVVFFNPLMHVVCCCTVAAEKACNRLARTHQASQ